MYSRAFDFALVVLRCMNRVLSFIHASILCEFSSMLLTTSLSMSESSIFPSVTSHSLSNFPRVSSSAENIPCICFRNRASSSSVELFAFLFNSRCLFPAFSSNSASFVLRTFSLLLIDMILFLASCLRLSRSTSPWSLFNLKTRIPSIRCTLVASVMDFRTHSSTPAGHSPRMVSNGPVVSISIFDDSSSSSPQNLPRSLDDKFSPSQSTVSVSISL
mmetsp:Transcript_9136/g.18104  ORF Transcript_9136/g.18104 Transcript_9136/m.18104 type:complete len:217 (+) Transcript_9136:445-1095(+)